MHSEIPTPLSHSACMVCGHHDSLGLQFRRHAAGVEAHFQARSQWQGYHGVLHGGMVSTLLDAAMTHCLFERGIEALTAHLNVRFLAPVPCTQLLLLRAGVLSQRKNVYQLCAELRCAGALLAKADAKFMPRMA